MPSIDDAVITAEIDALAAEARTIEGDHASDVDKLKAVRQVLYDAGAWNDNRPFSYDHDDPLGLHVYNKLLPTYLASRTTEEHTSELQSLMHISYAVFCLKKKKYSS